MSVLKKFKVIYWHNGNRKAAIIEATSRYNAKLKFYFAYAYDDIIRIEEVVE